MTRPLARLVGVMIGVLVLVSGCVVPQPHFRDRDGGRAYLLGELKAKYGRDFVLKSENFENTGGATYFSGRIHPVGAPSQEAGARVGAYGQLVDSWGVWPFADRMTAQPNQACASIASATKSCVVRPRVPASNKYWDPAMRLEDFLAQSNAANDVMVTYLATDERQLAPQILALIDKLDAGQVQYVLMVTRGGEPNVVFTHMTSQPKPTVQEILDTIP